MPSAISKIVLACLLLLPAARVCADEARTILERAIQAHGGEDRIARTKTGRLKAKGEGAFGGPFVVTWEETFDLPQRFRRIVERSDGPVPIRQEFAINGMKGWMRQGNGIPMDLPITEKVPLEQHWHAILATLLRLRGAETRLTYLGEDKRNGRTMEAIHVSSPAGDADMLFDKTTGLLARSRRSLPNFVTPTPIVGETSYEDYRAIDGVRYPMRFKATNGDTYSINLTLSSVEFLDKIDESAFAKPETVKPPHPDPRSLEQSPAGGGPLSERAQVPGDETRARWDLRLIVATFSVSAIVGSVWLIVRVAKRRREQAHPV